ncbi:LysM peptidoglycan-binding domain-containing protein, partial [Patescibacteria group bacterium]|nr:LysM peptidoglycan-binding domain-containing protein [Patescibacteria group bacterium]
MARVALGALTRIHTVVQFCGRGFSYIDGRIIDPVRRVFTRIISLPLYRIYFFAQLRLRKTVASTRGLFFLIFTSRYTLHILLIAFAVPIAALQLKTASASADVGQHSILYALVTNGQESVIEETSPQAQNTSASTYLAETVQPNTHIDFDYNITDENSFTTDYGLAGTIALRPQPTNIPTTNDTNPDTQFPVIATETPAEPIAESPSTDEKTPTTYTVRSGDTIASIARRNGVTQNTILWANGLTESSRLHPGDTLTILPVSGVLYTIKRGDTLAAIAKKYSVTLADLKSANPTDIKVVAGKTLIVPGGQPIATIATTKTSTAKNVATTNSPSTEVTASTPKIKVAAGASNIRPGVPIAAIKGKSVDVYQELANANNDTRAKPEDETPPEESKTTKLLWPTAQHLVNQYYGWNHTGIDINGDYTDPIYAAADGTVETAGWNSGGYGLQVVIEHAYPAQRPTGAGDDFIGVAARLTKRFGRVAQRWIGLG